LAFGLDDALVSWLVASAGDSMLSSLRGDPATRALPQLVETAVDEAVAVAANDLDREQVEHLRLVLREHDRQVGRVTVGSAPDLRTALRAWTAALDRREFGGSGYLTRLGIAADWLGDELADRITEGIRERGRAGGPLGPLADWLWRTELSIDVGQIKEDLSQLRNVVGPPGSYGGGLPGVTSDFTGRQQVLDELARRVQAHDPAGVVVAIHAVDGMPGVGKTELALRVAHQQRQSYLDGQYFIDLHGYTGGIAPVSPVAALEELLRQAGLPGQEIPADLAGRQARWQALMAGKRALVLLDNALNADQVRPLLPRAAGCLVLITSRSVLQGLPGARRLQLDVLPQEEAIELFTRVADSDKTLDRHALATAVELVGRLPLAVRAIASQVGDSYRETELAGDLTRAKKHANLVAEGGPLGPEARTAFDTSLQRLDPHHQRAFRILGVYPGPLIGVPQFAALAELPLPEASSTLRTLARRNLTTAPADQVGHRRYQLHDLLREYARQQAEVHMTTEKQLASVARLTTWYAAMIRTIDRIWFGTRPTEPEVEGVDLAGVAETGAWLVTEQENLLAFAARAAGPDAANVYCLYAERLRVIGYCATPRTLYGLARNEFRKIGASEREADTLSGSGEVARLSGDRHAADEHYRAALDLYRQTGNAKGAAEAFLGLGDVAQLSGDRHAAGELFRAALDLYRQAGNAQGAAEAFRRLGEVARLSGDRHAASENYRAALDLSRATSDAHEQASTLLDAGRVALYTDDYRAAAQHFRAARDLYRRVGSRFMEGRALLSLGELALAADDHPTARRRYLAALDIFRDLGQLSGQAHALWGLGEAARFSGDLRAADEHYSAALDISRHNGDADREVDALLGLGGLALAAGEHPIARERYSAALDRSQQTGNRAGKAAALAGLGRAAQAEGRHEEAHERWQNALVIYAEVNVALASSLREEMNQHCPE
jgi:tetratricopeptide (TPR) repeat protein